METAKEYRLRWTYEGGGSRTRYFSREHWARKAADRYRSRGLSVALDTRTVLELEPWAPIDSVSKVVQIQTLCALCGEPVTQDGLDWVSAGGWTYCTEAADSPRHTA